MNQKAVYQLNGKKNYIKELFLNKYKTNIKLDLSIEI